MLPVGDDGRPGRGITPITFLLIVLNVVVFLYKLSLGAGVENFIRTYGAVPAEILTGRDIPSPEPQPFYS